MRPFARALGIVLFAATCARAAHADEPVSASVRAEALFRAGQHLREAGEVHEACAKFEESHGLEPTLGALLNLADCHQEEGKIATAWKEFRSAVELAARTGKAEREKFAKQQVDTLAPKLSLVEVAIPDDVTVESLAFDGKAVPRERWRTKIELDPGEHRLDATARGQKPFSQLLSVSSGPWVGQVRLAFERPPPEPTFANASTANASSVVPGLVVGGVGVVGLGIGAVFGLTTFSKKSESESHCFGNKCDATGLSLREDASRSATISTIAFSVGVVAVAAGVYLVLSRSSGAAPSAKAAAAFAGGLAF